MNPLISVVILNYNGKEVVLDCLASVLQGDYSPLEVLVVDNASSDGSLELVRAQFPQVRVIANPINYGYAKGNNIGIGQSSGEYIVILNYDTVVVKDWLTRLVETMEERPNAGAAMPLLLLYGEKLINSDGNELNFLGFGWCGNYRKPKGEGTGIKSVGYPTGAAVMLRRRALEEVGLFDEDYYLAAQEDAELGLRLRLADYDILAVPDAVVYHKYNFRRSGKLALLERSRPLMLAKILEKKTLLFIFPAFLVVELAVLAYALRQGWLGDKLRSYGYLFRNWRRILESRRQIQQGRKQSDKVLLPWLKGGIYFPEVQNPALAYMLNPFLEAYWWLAKRLLKVVAQ